MRFHDGDIIIDGIYDNYEYFGIIDSKEHLEIVFGVDSYNILYNVCLSHIPSYLTLYTDFFED